MASIVMPAFATFASAAASFYEEQARDVFLQAIERIIEDGYRKSREPETAEDEKKLA